MKRILLFNIFFLCSIMAFAQFTGTKSDEQGVQYTANEDGTTCYVSGHEENYNAEIVVPESFEGLSVTGIGDYAFYGCSGLTSVTIPNSVTGIGDYAFYGCSGLTSVTIPNSVTSIGYSAFSGCSGLTSLTIGNSVTTIGNYAFRGCSGLTSIKVENGNTHYDSRDNCNAIIETNTNTLITGCQNTVIPNSVTSIGNYAFRDCSGLTSVTIPNSVTSIGDWAFYHCTGLTSVTIPNSVNSIGDGAFSGCSGLTSVTIGSSVASIGKRAFYGCRNLTSVQITDLAAWCNISFKGASTNQQDVYSSNPLYYAHHLFLNGEDVKDMVIPNSVTSIGERAFINCSGLTSVTIPNSVTSIGVDAFNGCSGLTSIKVERGNSKYDSRDNCNAIIETSTNTLISGCQNTIIPYSVTSIGYQAFWECRGLTSVTIPNSVTSIGNYAFRGCSGLTSVTIPNSVTSIGSFAFADCFGLTSVTIPNSVTSIGDAAFWFCESLTEVISMIEDPFSIDTSVWYYDNTDEIPLYVPAGTKEKYETTEGWNVFTNIIEMGIAPSEGEDINYGGGEISGETNLNGNVVGNIYYNIGDENGEYSSAEGCITLRTPVSDEQMSQVEGMDLFGEDMKNNFTGIIFMVQAGSGTIKVNAETTGNMTLKVKVGSSKPMTFRLNGQLDAELPYEVSEPTYVYIYGGGSSAAGAKGVRKAAGDGEVKIYGISWTSGTNGIETIDNGQLKIDNSPVYNLNGQRVQSLQKGINIVNGKKVLAK